jgi:hypothetical protein
MKEIVTLDKGNQPYGFPQLDANGNLTSSVTASYALTASYAMNGGGGGVSGGSDGYIPVWSGSNGLTSSFLTQYGNVLRTTSSYDNGYPGIYIDLTNDVYGFGNIIGKPSNTANGIVFQTGTSYFNTSNGINSLIFELNSSANIIQTNGGNTGLKLDFTNDLYQFGNFTNSSITITGSQVEITGSELKFSGQTNFNNAVAVNDSNLNLTNSSSLNLTSGSSVFIDSGSLVITTGSISLNGVTGDLRPYKSYVALIESQPTGVSTLAIYVLKVFENTLGFEPTFTAPDPNGDDYTKISGVWDDGTFLAKPNMLLYENNAESQISFKKVNTSLLRLDVYTNAGFSQYNYKTYIEIRVYN